MPERFYVSLKGLIVKEEKALLLAGTDPEGRLSWDLPGGRMDPNENTDHALRRELKEELPSISNIIIVRHLHVFRDEMRFPDGTPVVYNIFEIDANLPEVTLSNEHTGFHWITKNELKDFEKSSKRRITPGFLQAVALALQ